MMNDVELLPQTYHTAKDVMMVVNRLVVSANWRFARKTIQTLIPLNQSIRIHATDYGRHDVRKY
jgi:hypothetical protein